jgi:4,5:9,10-diseco-3-hydroxy-5,9,17-trioxoandrosta-1(10),2-diene-4-oate hydrolase
MPWFSYSVPVNTLSRIEVPTLVIWGREDRLVPLAHAEIAVRLIRHAVIQVLDGCGHVPQFERPDEFNALVDRFCNPL